MDKVKPLVNSIIASAQERKAHNIVIVDMTDLPGAICQYFVICEGNSPNQNSAICDKIIEDQKKSLKERPISTEGLPQCNWVGIDYGTVIVHIMLPEAREFYDLDHLWADAKIEAIPDLD